MTCPKCGRPIDAIRPSPRATPGRRPHLAAVYPCGCWLTPAAAYQLGKQAQETTEAAR